MPRRRATEGCRIAAGRSGGQSRVIHRWGAWRRSRRAFSAGFISDLAGGGQNGLASGGKGGKQQLDLALEPKGSDTRNARVQAVKASAHPCVGRGKPNCVQQKLLHAGWRVRSCFAGAYLGRVLGIACRRLLDVAEGAEGRPGAAARQQHIMVLRSLLWHCMQDRWREEGGSKTARWWTDAWWTDRCTHVEGDRKYRQTQAPVAHAGATTTWECCVLAGVVLSSRNGNRFQCCARWWQDVPGRLRPATHLRVLAQQLGVVFARRVASGQDEW